MTTSSSTGPVRPAITSGAAAPPWAPRSEAPAGSRPPRSRSTTRYTPEAGDLDGDGDEEILWYASGPTPDPIWFGQPTGLPSARTVSVAGAYLPLIGDVDGQAGEDIVWLRATSTVPVWWSYDGP